VSVVPATAETIDRAATLLRDGQLVAFPTETVYGLGADATSDAAVQSIFAAKGRPSFNPLIVHVHDRTWVAGIARPDGRFDHLARRFWPGPLTLVMRRRADCPISALASAGGDTIAIRSPDHPIANQLLAAVRRPLAAPSANRSGQVSPTRAEHVSAELAAALILDGGACRVGVESTVLDLTSDIPTILRPGSVGRRALEEAIGEVRIGADEAAPRSPGQLASHYAPSLPVRLNAASAQAGQAMLGFGSTAGDLNLSAAGDVAEAAANLFAMLRALDQPGKYTAIAVAPIPDAGVGLAINDRLRRAAAPRK
jgi:L-threonylcarbamoyladenylate synthase